MLSRIANTIREHHLFERGDTVLLAVSGGIDSMVLLHTLWKLRDQLGVRLLVAHVDHGLRGEESAADRAFVEAAAQELGLPVFTKRFDVASYAGEHQLSVQTAARDVRYAYLEKTARENGAARIATAHHGDDQAETVLMRIMRGTALRGLGGIPIRREEVQVSYVRPLLGVWRAEIEAYAQQNGIVWREDPSNASTKYMRNKIRIQLLPHLQAEYNPDLKHALVQLANTARDDDDYLMKLAREKYASLVTVENKARIRVDVNQLAVLPLPLQRRVITLILYYLRGHTKQWEHVHIESIRALLTHPYPSAEVTLPDQVLARREYGVLYIGDPEENRPPDEQTVRADVCLDVRSEQGVHTFSQFGITLDIRWVDGVPKRPQDAWEIHLDADELSSSRIYIRTWATGDSIRPMGMQGKRKLISDIFIDAKVPKHRRHSWPLLMIEGEIAWVVGIRRGRQAAVTDQTRKTLVLRATPIS